MRHALSNRERGIYVFLSAALCVILFYMTAYLAPLATDNAKTFITSNATLSDYMQLRQEWRPRILSNAFARVSSIVAGKITSEPQDHLAVTVGIFCAAWLFLTNLIVLVAFGRGSLIFFWGIFSALAFGYAPGLVTRVYPWDMPILFVFTLFIAIYHRGAFGMLPIVILMGALFKETTVVLIPALLFLPVSWCRRFKHFFITGIAFVILKIIVDTAVGNPIPFFSPTIRPPNSESLRLVDNIGHLSSIPKIAQVMCINAGTLVVIFLLRNKDIRLLMLKCVVACFTVNIFVFGVITEYRIWFEAIPLALYGILLSFFEEKDSSGCGVQRDV